MSISKGTAGTAQVQKSAIQTDGTSSDMAGLSTKLGSLASMSDLAGNSKLDAPQTLVLKGNGQTAEVIMSSDQTLNDFANKVQAAVTGSVGAGGLGISGSTFAFDAKSGQFVYESGREGSIGELSFGGDEGILQGLAMQETIASVDAAYTITAKEVGVTSGAAVSQNTTNGRSSGVIGGLDLQFELSSEARLGGSIAATEAITIGSANAIFTFHDSNGKDNNQAASNISAGVTITLTANRTFTTASIATLVNNTIAAANDAGSSLVGAATSSSYKTQVLLPVLMAITWFSPLLLRGVLGKFPL